MSEYQYYEFRAVDHTLNAREISELRTMSSRAVISRTSFSNYYTFGDLKADPRELLTKYFDASIYFANWMFVDLAFRYAKDAIDVASIRRYRAGQSFDIRVKGADVIVAVSAERDNFDADDDGRGWLSSLLPLRASVSSGDERFPYFGWLLGVQSGEIRDNAREPARPAELGLLTPALETFIDIMGLNVNLVAAVVEGTRPPAKIEGNGLDRWIGTLDDREKAALLSRVARGDGSVGPALMRRFRQQSGPNSRALPLRTAAQLRARAEELEGDRRRALLARQEKERDARKRAEAAERRRCLGRLAKRQPQAWRQIEALIATMQPRHYDAAVRILDDLREIGAQQGRATEFGRRIKALRRSHANKSSLLARLRKAAL
jgi:hypothetical protein